LTIGNQFLEPYWFVIFVLGIPNYVSTIIYSVDGRNKSWKSILLGVSGLPIAFPPLFFTYLSPLILVYLFFSIDLFVKRKD
tara:strand:- start:2158 stop:2400 length:243 start_codon:yes stop_codon:yes gene_type:complete